MMRLIFSVLIITGFFLIQGCITQKHATTIERDKENPCIIRMVLQIGINGTDGDVDAVTNDLQACFGKECFIPCESDQTKGCKVMVTVVVKKWSSLSEDEKESFHRVNMVDNDGLPSRAQVGTPNKGPAVGEWRRNEPPRAYCHEVLHLCGLLDQYCSRLYDAATNEVIQENNCYPPPDPNGGNCCTPTSEKPRCGAPCEGHEHDLMASIQPELSCQNILDVMKLANFDKCPEECCTSQSTFSSEAFVGPGYLHFGDKDNQFGNFGVTLEYTYPLNSKIGITIDAGAYMHKEKDNDYKQNNKLYTITGGISYVPKVFYSESKLSLSTHALAGIMNYSTKFTFAGEETKNSQTSLCFNVGTSLSYELNSLFNIRLLQVDYMPTFFGDATQHNYRIGAGLSYNIGK